MYFDSLPEHTPRRGGFVSTLRSLISSASSTVFARLPRGVQRRFGHNPQAFAVQLGGVALVLAALVAVPLLAYQVSTGDFDTRQQAFIAKDDSNTSSTVQKTGTFKPETEQTTTTETAEQNQPKKEAQPAEVKPISGSAANSVTPTDTKAMIQPTTNAPAPINTAVGGSAQPTTKQKCIAKLGSQSRYTKEKLSCQLQQADWNDGLCKCRVEAVPSIADVVNSSTTKPPAAAAVAQTGAGKPPGTTGSTTTGDTESATTNNTGGTTTTGSFSGTVLVCVHGEEYIKGLAADNSNVDGVGTGSFCVQVASSYSPNQIRDICRNTWAADGSYYRNNGLISSPSACDTDLIIRSGASGWGVVSATTNNASKPISQSVAIANPASTVDYYQTVNRVEELVAITEKKDDCTTAQCQAELRAAQAEIDKLANRQCVTTDLVCLLNREAARTASEIARQNSVEQQARVAAETSKKDQTELGSRLNEALNNAATSRNNSELAAELRDQLDQTTKPVEEIETTIQDELVDPGFSLALREELYERDCSSGQQANDPYCASLASSIIDKRREVDQSRANWLKEVSAIVTTLRAQGESIDRARTRVLFNDYCKTGVAEIDDSDICSDFENLLSPAASSNNDSAATGTTTGNERSEEEAEATTTAQTSPFNLGTILTNLATSVLQPTTSTNTQGQTCTTYFFIFKRCTSVQTPDETEATNPDDEASSAEPVVGTSEEEASVVLNISDFSIAVIGDNEGSVSNSHINQLMICYKRFSPDQHCNILGALIPEDQRHLTTFLSGEFYVDEFDQIHFKAGLDDPNVEGILRVEVYILLSAVGF